MIRLDKFLCDCGIGTRSQVKVILKAGRVTVDGKPEKDGSRKIDPERQQQRLLARAYVPVTLDVARAIEQQCL
mgnify:CR=1 FL=1